MGSGPEDSDEFYLTNRFSMIKAVIFDNDGVISDSEPWHVQSEILTMQKHGIALAPADLRRYTGGTAWDMFEDLIKRYGVDATVEELFRDKEKVLFDLLEKNLKPIHGVIELINRIHQKGLKLAIGSSGHKRLVEFTLNKFRIRDFFDAVVTGQDVAEGKPAPDIYLLAAEKLGMLPSECIVIEDATLGVRAAKAAGMKCIGYDTGKQDLSEADSIVASFEEVEI